MKTENRHLFYRAIFDNLAPFVKQTSGKDRTAQEWLVELGLDKKELDAIWTRTVPEGIFEKASILADGREGLLESSPVLEDIFNHFQKTPSQRFFDSGVLSFDEPHKAQKEQGKENVKKRQTLLADLEQEIKTLDLSAPTSPDSLLNLVEKYLSFVPSSRVADLSLAVHSRLKAGFALALAEFQASEPDLSLTEDTPAFLLLSFDLSGIQDFIYNISTTGAAKQLKARSLYLDVMSEYLSDSLLETLGLNRANLLYAGGGHAYLLLANTRATREKVERFETAYQSFLLEHFQTRIYVAFGLTGFSMREIMSHQDQLSTYRQIYQRVSRQISEKKISRYSAAILKELNKGDHRAEQECAICHSIGKLEYYSKKEQVLCPSCHSLYDFSDTITNTDYFMVTKEPKGLPIGPGAYLRAVSEKEVEKIAPSHLYVKNQFASCFPYAIPLFIGDSKAGEIYDYANLSVIKEQETDEVGKGIKRLAVLRLDVDNLGAAFMAGFSYQDQGRYNGLARSAMFSRSMSLFFKVYINYFAKDKNITIIYAGGDDVFAIGSWQDTIAFAVELRQAFRDWTADKLTLSAGIGLFADKFPIRQMAAQTGELEEAAKENDKDSISLFAENYTFKFDDFINHIYEDKLVAIREFFSGQDQRGFAFVYRLLEFLQSKDTMAKARLVYYLARLEDLTTNDTFGQEKFRKFKEQFLNWYQAGIDSRKELELALILYVYENRKETRNG